MMYYKCAFIIGRIVLITNYIKTIIIIIIITNNIIVVFIIMIIITIIVVAIVGVYGVAR